ncbi:hypothetical protein [Streptomyces akebiae]|uniref:Uncharacterized protein n=1 Tax=Streptomyces akebiae TaxID=2865673 RepID=A0ABX8XYD8_9ACTN|nr:hypothetical protein [Streptomyces akebiae]QYX80538.1 hypothetical protein K1J60_32060 [Streptomyces akebiae]
MGSPPQQPEEGDIRFYGPNVEYFNGTAWVRHEELPDDQAPPDLRGDDEDFPGPDDHPPLPG